MLAFCVRASLGSSYIFLAKTIQQAAKNLNYRHPDVTGASEWKEAMTEPDPRHVVVDDEVSVSCLPLVVPWQASYFALGCGTMFRDLPYSKSLSA